MDVDTDKGKSCESGFVDVITEDGQNFKMPRSTFSQIGIFRAASEDMDMTCFPLHTINSNILVRIIEYLDMHADDPPEDPSSSENEPFAKYTPYSDFIPPKDRRFINSLDLPTLVELTKAANFLHIPDLLELCCRGVAGHMRGLTTEQLRAKFNIVNDFTPEEEERLRKDPSTCFYDSL